MVVVVVVMVVVVWCVLPRSIGHSAKRASADGSGVTTDRLVAPAATVGATRAVAAAAASSAVVVVVVVMVVVWCVLPRSIGHAAKRAGVYCSGVTTDRRARQAGSVGLRMAPSAAIRRRRGSSPPRLGQSRGRKSADVRNRVASGGAVTSPRAAASPSASRESAIGWVTGRPRATLRANKTQ